MPQTSDSASATPARRLDTVLSAVAAKAQAADVFGEVRVVTSPAGPVLSCAAKASAEPAEFRLFLEKDKLWVALVTEHRWLSQSIEADLVNTGDKMEDLIEEELVEQGWEKHRLTVEHFRDDRKMYTFRSSLTPPLDAAASDTATTVDKATRALLAYEAAFRVLGDMEE